MTRIRFYLDEDIMDSSLVQALRVRDVDIITVVEAGRGGLLDEEQLLWATAQNRVICTCNIGDFARLHRAILDEGQTHAGIILIPQQVYSVGARSRGLVKIFATKTAVEMRDKLEFLSKYLQK